MPGVTSGAPRVRKVQAGEGGEETGSSGAGVLPDLSAIPMFRDLDPVTLRAVQDELQWLTLPGGSALFREGEKSDFFYIVISGRLGVLIEGDEDEPRFISQIGTGETVGEMGMITGEPRTATVIAIRYTELLGFSKSAYDRLTVRHPKLMRRLLELLARRLAATTHKVSEPRVPKTLAVIPLGDDVPGIAFIRGLAAALKSDGLRVKIVDQADAERPIEWFYTIEAAHDLVLYFAAAESVWCRFCLRQADRVLFVAVGRREPPPAPVFNPPRQQGHATPADLVLLHPADDADAAIARPWLEILSAGMQCNVREGNETDLGHLGRLLTGRAVGLVLSGGAARGFAHIGVIRALRQSGVPIDLIGAASMGSIVAAGVALGWDDDELTTRLRHAFVDSNPVRDYTLPLLSLVRGREVTKRLRENFGEARIENLWRPYFCISSNLTAGHAKIHRSGLLWQAVRASIAIPGILPPVIEGEEVLVDGGVMNNFPVDIMRDLRRGPVIGVDVVTKAAPMLTAANLGDGTVGWWIRNGFRRPGIVSVLMRAGTVGSDAQTNVYRHRVDLLLDPPIESIDLMDWHAFDRAIEAGYRSTMEALERPDSPTLERPPAASLVDRLGTG
jgi:NTE family protein